MFFVIFLVLRRIELTPTSGRATLYLSVGLGTEPDGGHRCFNVHAVGPKVRTKPAHVRVLDYYTPTINDTQVPYYYYFSFFR